MLKGRIGPSLALLALIVVAAKGLWLNLSSVSPHQQIAQTTQSQSAGDYGYHPIALFLAALTFVRGWLLWFADLLNENQWTAISTFLLVIVTGLLAGIAYGAIRTTRRQMRAYVFVDIGSITNVA